MRSLFENVKIEGSKGAKIAQRSSAVASPHLRSVFARRAELERC